MNKCDVCGKETKTIVCSSTCGAISFAYCEDCLRNGIEPYDALVGMGLFYADINTNYKKNILDPSLKFHGKTREQFDDDVQAQEEEYLAWLSERENEIANSEENDDETLPF